MELKWINVKSALISTGLMAILSVVSYVVQINDIFAVDWKALVNVGVISLATGIVSLVKSLLTNDSGVFMGTVKIAKSDK